MSGIYEGPHGQKLYGDGKVVQNSPVTAREDQPQLGTCDKFGPKHPFSSDCKNWRPEDQPRPTPPQCGELVGTAEWGWQKCREQSGHKGQHSWAKLSRSFSALVADLRKHYDTDWDTTVPGKEFDAEISRIVQRHLASEAQGEAPQVSDLLGKYLNTMVSDLRIDGKGQYLRELFSKYEAELVQTGGASEPGRPHLRIAIWH